MSNIVNIKDFIENKNNENKVERQLNENLDAIYFANIEKLQKNPEYVNFANQMMHLRDLVIGAGVDEKLVDALIEATEDKTSMEYEYLNYTLMDALFGEDV